MLESTEARFGCVHSITMHMADDILVTDETTSTLWIGSAGMFFVVCSVVPICELSVDSMTAFQEHILHCTMTRTHTT